MLNIVAKITPIPALFNECKGRLQNILTPTLAESGCIRFEFYSNAEQTSLFLIERFESQQALDKHYQQSYVKEVFEFYATALAVPVEVNKLINE